MSEIIKYILCKSMNIIIPIIDYTCAYIYQVLYIMAFHLEK